MMIVFMWVKLLSMLDRLSNNMKIYTNNVLLILVKKAKRSPCNYRVVALGIDNKGRHIGIKTNTPRYNMGDNVKYRNGYHAEERLIHSMPRSLSKIIIARVGKDGRFLPINPCKHCLKLATNRNITIETVYGQHN